MKYSLSFLLVVLSVCSATKTSAQVSNGTSAIEKPIAKFDPTTGFDNIDFQPGLKLPLKSLGDTSLKARVFRGELPIAKGTREVKNEPATSSNMPVLKSKNNSKILIAKVDLDFPFHYNMPIKKIEGN
ncbi:hypothetical protein [Desertivirga arenae]|uniref:hypothetical protein n=1 Tax=Desertivirga arenae TaxID=2810309 RepID=UPI001A974355|nr:hypothetical protein [Pedobacter sp. SYSU D00823]